MWEIYDALIEGIPAESKAEFLACGARHTVVRAAGGGVGVCGTLCATRRSPTPVKKTPGMRLRALAECVKSWEFVEAGLGLAAINAWYNDRERLCALGLDISDRPFVEDRSADPFITLQNEIKGKRVTVVGHFPYIDKLFAPVCDMAIIEKFNPKDGDYPEQAAEFLLPESEYVFISAYTFVEKTLPRYLALSRNAKVTIVGPSTPVAPVLHEFGVHSLAGFCIRDGDAARDIALGHSGNLHGVGRKVHLKLPPRNLHDY
jgi:uncharacterized protein (DUF4213/DUF364 family)